MGLADDLRKPPANVSQCCIARARRHFEGEDLKMLNETIEQIANRDPDCRDGGPNQTWFARVLSDNGFPITGKGVSNHFRKACACGVI